MAMGCKNIKENTLLRMQLLGLHQIQELSRTEKLFQSLILETSCSDRRKVSWLLESDDSKARLYALNSF